MSITSAGAPVVIVTGASRGIGLEICRRFARRGAKLGMIARDPGVLKDAGASLDAVTHTVSADVSDRDRITAGIAEIEATLGPASVLVNNAGIGQWSAVVDTEPDLFVRTIEVNYLGAVHATAAVLAGMLDRGQGHIVNVSSIAGHLAAPFEAAYSASKFALVAYSNALAAELHGSGVVVSLVSPGPVDTDFGRLRGQTYDRSWPRPVGSATVAAAVERAVDEDRAEQLVPGWFRLACTIAAVAPRAYRSGVRRAFRRERRALLGR